MGFIPKDYFDSRERFRQLADAAGGKLTAYPVSSNFPSNGSLSVDTVILGPENAGNILVVVSGTHGIEGYAGSACLQHFLTHYTSAWKEQGIAVLAVHALNPWGFANDSRVTEDNIDLNRNFIDFSRPLPCSDQYARFHPVLCERYAPGLAGLANECRLYAGVLTAKRRRAFQDAVTSGQYHRRDGLFYGGDRVTQNREIWTRIMRESLETRSSVRFLDIHTGLGKKGHGALLTHLPVSSPKFETLNHFLDGQLTSTTQDANISAFVSGPLPTFVEDSLGDKCHTVTLEFGVSGPAQTLHALRADNWLRTTRHKKEAALRKAGIKRRLRGVFLNDDPSWESDILERFGWTVQHLVSSFETGGQTGTGTGWLHTGRPGAHQT